MTLLNPNDIADVLSLIRDIGDRLDGIGERLDGIDGRLDDIEENAGRIEEDTAEITTRLAMLASVEPGHGRAVALAVEAVLADLIDRQSLIPAGDGDGYDQDCPGCLLKKNGYPRLAQLFAGAAPDGEQA